ncbi:hypothetical protein EDB85DRAFT_1896817 [Lactarius pseudohatsudake]|nr:hypothetical protein EDB85DRAFT_1898764 [Lactarius pseudohatsudake]KAH9019231.1 hypothetical protein EDB85DRAFT_1896817 [Lactarius pseudohatsudake]
MLEHGFYFISGVTLQRGIALRMGGGDTVLVDSIAQLYGVADEEDLNIRFNVRAWNRNAHERNNSRIQNRRKVPVDVRDIVADEELQAQDRTLSDQGVATMPLHREAGPDIAPPRVHQMNEDRDPEESIDDRVARIWRQSNCEPSYLPMMQQERREATVEVFKHTDLRRVLSRAVVKVLGSKDWKFCAPDAVSKLSLYALLQGVEQRDEEVKYWRGRARTTLEAIQDLSVAPTDRHRPRLEH